MSLLVPRVMIVRIAGTAGFGTPHARKSAVPEVQLAVLVVPPVKLGGNFGTLAHIQPKLPQVTCLGVLVPQMKAAATPLPENFSLVPPMTMTRRVVPQVVRQRLCWYLRRTRKYRNCPWYLS